MARGESAGITVLGASTAPKELTVSKQIPTQSEPRRSIISLNSAQVKRS